MILPISVLLAAGLILYAGLHNMTVTDALGQLLGRKPSGKLGSLSGAPSVSSGTLQPSNSGNNLPFQGIKDVSRLDQGIDVTATDFTSPVNGTVVASEQSSSGWKGGGYIAVQDNADPNRVYYYAEGISPILQKGAKVKTGERVGIPVNNPYNGVVGNIEFGRANPSSPTQPLAQVVSNPAGLVLNMYHWLLSLGIPKARDTSNAGKA